MMDLSKEEIYVTKQQKKKKKIEKTAKTKACISCLWSFLVITTGGLILGYWEYEYHSTYSQLWMVPVGLILLITPVTAWLAVSISEICMGWEQDGSKSSRPVGSVGDSDPDLEK